jgi:predicted RNA-binding protein YlqC (UPF0109 family)
VSDVHDDYVEGDINTIDENDSDDGFADDGGTGGAAQAVTAKAALEFIATSLADDPSAVSVQVNERQGKVVLSLQVGPDDMGRVIGRRGRTAQAIRSLVAAAGARDGVTATVDIVD